MRSVYSLGVCLSAAALAVVITINDRVWTQDTEGGPQTATRAAADPTATLDAATAAATEAPTGFDLVSNGFTEEFCGNQDNLSHSTNSPKIPADECSFAAALGEFDGHESFAEGIGPVYNATGCGECHGNPIIGGTSQVAERRAGFFSPSTGFVEHPGGSLIHDRSIYLEGHPSIQETINANSNVFTFRLSQSILGDGFVEAIGGPTLALIAALQPSSMRGQTINVPVFEQPGTTRVGRFGWKNQQASLTSFSADAYLNEMGITSPLQPTENTSNGNPVDDYDEVADPDNSGVDVELFALFMRSTKAPPVDPELAAAPDAVAGSALFNQVGCNVCHTRTITTDAPGTVINGGALIVSRTLGGKRIHPFGDFLLHDIGTGDGIVQNGGASTRNKVRTAPLWGLRARGRFMHDGLSQNVEDAISRHDNQALNSRRAFKALSLSDQRRVLAFLRSL
jgi:Di-haem oxidoreductase, putative peroxidase